MVKVKSYFDKEKVIKITKQAQLKSLIMSLILAFVMVVIAIMNFVTAINKEEMDWFGLVFSVIIIVVTFFLLVSALKTYKYSAINAVKEMHVEDGPIELEYIFKEKKVEVTTVKNEVAKMKTVMYKNISHVKIDGKGIAIYLNGDNMFYVYDTDFVEGNKQNLAVTFSRLGIKVK